MDKLTAKEKESILEALKIMNTHYLRCISTSRVDRTQTDAGNAIRVVNEAAFDEWEKVSPGLEILLKLFN